ncbi:hypothetical protein P0092_01965 [Ruminiclostridium papyrosolvens DSM 2782]|uniref:hypothetical protein n=1 Tax=Ruminiclostridium papyrosolvens TaxID=29362 RepID=UPI0023E42F69|nr:hypothetical protein [Ruminiclostridium papyrosolvens]WES34769.1 hypothetical protein P0092_01965 [Ruminiclostridium papyrosolvens DSM 2782]
MAQKTDENSITNGTFRFSPIFILNDKIVCKIVNPVTAPRIEKDILIILFSTFILLQRRLSRKGTLGF